MNEWSPNAFDFSFDFDEMLIVLLIVIFDKSSFGLLLLFLGEILGGTSHWPYNEDNSY